MRDVGLSERQIRRRVEGFQLFPIFAGVFAVGHPGIGFLGRVKAAELATGPASAACRMTAAMIHGIERTVPDASPHILVPRGKCGDAAGMVVHRTRRLPAEDVCLRQGIRVTTIARTLRDLAAVVDERRLRRLFEEADRLGLLDIDDLWRIIAESNGHRGVARLRALAAKRSGSVPRARSHLEHRFVRVCQENDVPVPLLNVRIGRWTVDCLWPDEKLVVELDGHAYHKTRGARRRDAQKARELELMGHRVVRFDWAEVEEDPGAAAEQTLAFLDLQRNLK